MKCRAFTLIELMVVASIIILVAAVAIPAIGPMMASNQMSEAVGTLNGLLTTAQTAAQAKGTAVGIRIERAFEVGPHGHMLKPGGVPIWLDHQQARIVDFAGGSETQASFSHDTATKVHVLPKRAWLAPGYCLKVDPPNPPANARDTIVAGSLADAVWPAGLLYDPLLSSGTPAVSYNVLDTFYIVFNKDGELTRFDRVVPSTGAGETYYVDVTQAGSPRVGHPEDSARSVLVYERKKWDGINRTDGGARLGFLRQEARVVNINRATGSITGSSQP